MSVAFPSRLRLSAPKHPHASSGDRYIRVATRGLCAAAITLMIFAAALIAAGRLLAVSVDAHSETRSIVGLAAPSRGLLLVARPEGGMAVPLQVALDFTTPEAALLLDDDGLDTLGLLTALGAASSGTLADLSADQIFTGSIAPYTTRFASADLATSTLSMAERTGSIPKLQDRPFPMPKGRPQLASLPPSGDFGIAPDDDPQTAKTAVYDITARLVYMPNGEKLEAHSGLGQYMDDPRHVRLRMRGVTPPNSYKLRMREALFHGVEAIRMTPEDKDAMFGRDGILAHSYMLGPSGQSNGCLSFKNYPKFLAAFKRGEVERIVVVARLDKPPSFFARRNIKSANAFWHSSQVPLVPANAGTENLF